MIARIIILAALPLLAAAQPPAPAASAPSAPRVYTDADITRDTACAAPAVGRICVGQRRGVVEQRDGAPGQRVDGDGCWEVGCKPAPPPPGPSGCAGGGPATWTVGGHTCTSDVSTANASSPARRQPLQHGQAQLLQQVTGATRGHLLEVCADGVRQQRLAACAPASHCAGPWRTTRDGGRTVYRLDGTIPVGQAGYAMANDGSTLRVRCDAGIIRAAPQCQAGQEVVRTRTWERTTYRYSGPPVEPGALVRAHEVARVDTRTTPPTALQTGVRAVMAPCGADGRLQ